MRKEYAQKITKDYLKKLGVEYVNPNGTSIIIKGKPATLHLNGKKRQYLKVSLYDPDLRQETPIEEKTRSTGTISLGVHVINYVWNKGDKPAGLVCDHIDNNSLNNDISNLQLLTQAENLEKEKGESAKQIPCKLDRPLSYYETKLNNYVLEYEEAKNKHNAKACHTLRGNIANTKARIRYWLAHQEEAEKLIKEREEKMVYKRDEHYHEVAKMKKYVSEKSKEMTWRQGKELRRFVRLYNHDRDYEILKQLYTALNK